MQLWSTACLCLGLVGCHTISRVSESKPGKVTFIVDQTTATGTTPTIALTEAGRLRFEIPLQCEGQEFVELETTIEQRKQPNIGTFMLGVFATAIGGALTARGLLNDDRQGDPFTYVGPVAVAAGASLAIGPWIGNSREIIPGATQKTPRFKRKGECGARPLTGHHAELVIAGSQVYGTVDANGIFSVSPYEFVDAFETTKPYPLDITAALVAENGSTQAITAVIPAAEVAKRRSVFLVNADFDADVPPFRLVANFAQPKIRASLTSISSTPALRIVIEVTNEGPGPSAAFRSHVSANLPEVDSRVLYFGKIAKGQTVSRELLIPLTAQAATKVRNTEISLSASFFDAYGTAPGVPVRFAGFVLNDLPR